MEGYEILTAPMYYTVYAVRYWAFAEYNKPTVSLQMQHIGRDLESHDYCLGKHQYLRIGASNCTLFEMC